MIMQRPMSDRGAAEILTATRGARRVSLDLENSLNLNRNTQRKRRRADGRTRMATRLAQRLNQKIRRAVDHLRLLR